MSTEKERKHFVETTGDERGERKKERKHFVETTGDERGERKKTLCGDHR